MKRKFYAKSTTIAKETNRIKELAEKVGIIIPSTWPEVELSGKRKCKCVILPGRVNTPSPSCPAQNPIISTVASSKENLRFDFLCSFLLCGT